MPPAACFAGSCLGQQDKDRDKSIPFTEIHFATKRHISKAVCLISVTYSRFSLDFLRNNHFCFGECSSKINCDTFTTALTKVHLEKDTISDQPVCFKRSTGPGPDQLRAGFKQVLGVRQPFAALAALLARKEEAVFSLPMRNRVWKPSEPFYKQQNAPRLCAQSQSYLLSFTSHNQVDSGGSFSELMI